MNLTFSYILSQIAIIICYILLIPTYHLKTRKSILLFSLASLISASLSYCLLAAYTGVAMEVVAIIRNLLFILFENKNSEDKISKLDILLLIIIYSITIVLATLTYSGVLGLTFVFATMIYTYSVWQKNPKTYKLLGIPVGIMGVTYNIYIFSIFGIIAESCLLISAIIGYLKDIKNN